MEIFLCELCMPAALRNLLVEPEHYNPTEPIHQCRGCARPLYRNTRAWRILVGRPQPFTGGLMSTTLTVIGQPFADISLFAGAKYPR